MKQLFKRMSAAAVLAASVFAVAAHASVVVTGTRVVYPAEDREVTIKLSNVGKLPALVQSWLDKGDPSAALETLDVPFTLTPSIFRMEPGKGQTLRLAYTKEPLATDKESLFWLNVLEVPPKSNAEEEDVNKLQLAFRTRIKVFFRPQGLPGSADEAPAQARWEVVRNEKGDGYALKATNPTPYYVNLAKVTLTAAGKSYDAGSGYVAPGQSNLFPVQDMLAHPGSGANVGYTALNDWGGDIKGEQPISAAPAH